MYVKDLQKRLEKESVKFHLAVNGSLGQGNEVHSLDLEDPLGNHLHFTNETFFDNSRLVHKPSLVNLGLINNAATVTAAEESPKAPGRRIAFLTSGGDCSGMNASIRSIVRYALAKGCEPFAVYEGYQGK